MKQETGDRKNAADCSRNCSAVACPKTGFRSRSLPERRVFGPKLSLHAGPVDGPHNVCCRGGRVVEHTHFSPQQIKGKPVWSSNEGSDFTLEDGDFFRTIHSFDSEVELRHSYDTSDCMLTAFSRSNLDESSMVEIRTF